MTALLQSALLCSLLLLLLAHQAKSASSTLPLVGKTCNTTNTRLLVDNNQLTSDCGYVAWCDSSDNTCKKRGCRRDEWPFGFNKVDRDLWPPLCPSGQFCPDEGSYCMSKMGLGQPCQLSRDDECIQSASVAGVKCLHNVCVAVNATLNTNCIIENTIYTDFTDRNNNYGDIISRDNCMSGLYCDAPTTQCLQKLSNDQSCSADKECSTGYCYDSTFTSTIPVNNNSTGKCGIDPVKVKSRVWVYIIIAVVIVVAMAGLGVWLITLHLRQTKIKRAAREEYWQGQKSISGKARLIDDGIRSNSDPYLVGASQPSLASLRMSYQSTTSTVKSTTPLKRESKLQHQKRYSDTNRQNSDTNRHRRDSSGNTTGNNKNVKLYTRSSILNQATDRLNNNNNNNNNHSDLEEKYATPSQSMTDLGLLEAFSSPEAGPSRASSSAVDSFANPPTDYMRSRDSTRSRISNKGWMSPDTHLG